MDYFALLNEPRRPWLEPDALKRNFLQRSAELHPDRFHNAGSAEKEGAQKRYAELNAAYQCLREPKERLRHLLELERGAKLSQLQNTPSALMDFSLQIGGACREADAFLAEKRKAKSALLLVELFERGQDQVHKSTQLLQRLAAQTEQMIEQLKKVDAQWENSEGKERQEQLTTLEEVYRLLGYFERWSRLLRERLVQLAE